MVILLMLWGVVDGVRMSLNGENGGLPDDICPVV